MKYRVYSNSVMIMTVFLFLSCSAHQKLPKGYDPLARKWMLTKMEGTQKAQLLKGVSYINLTHLDRAQASAGCNILRLQIHRKSKNKIALKKVGSSRKYCAEFMKLETQLTIQLDQIRSYSLQGHFIYFKNASGKIILEGVASDWD